MLLLLDKMLRKRRDKIFSLRDLWLVGVLIVISEDSGERRHGKGGFDPVFYEFQFKKSRTILFSG
jgi:hypothetical protein